MQGGGAYHASTWHGPTHCSHATVQVHGDGVVGCYPLLRDGGYRDDRQSQYSSAVRRGEECEGTFIYQVRARRAHVGAWVGASHALPHSPRTHPRTTILGSR